MEDQETLYPPYDIDLDLSFTSCTSTTTFTNSSARTSLARSSLTLSFNDRLSTTSTTTTKTTSISHPHRRCDPHWSAIKAATTLSSDGKLHLRHLKLIRHLGTGNLGRVFLCRLRDCDNNHANANFALKVVNKEALSPKKLTHVQTEAQILSMLDHPFLPTLYAHFEVSNYTCLLIDHCPNGDLHALLRKQPGNRLPMQLVKFYAAEVLVALEYLHAIGIVYRDLKPENILLREDGHIMLSDFDLCFKSDVTPSFTNRVLNQNPVRKRSRRNRNVLAEFVAEPTTAFSRSCVGTHEYLAPELVSGNGHGNGVDWWAFGVLIYELVYGMTPFKGANKECTLRNIASSKDFKFPNQRSCDPKITSAAHELIEMLLVNDPQRRLGCYGGATEIKRHRFFDGVKWPLIRMYRPPEIRGVVMRRTVSRGKNMISSGFFNRRKKCWLKRVVEFVRNKGNVKSSNFGNSNYYQYVDYINRKKKFA